MPINPMILEKIRTNDPSLTSLNLSDNQIDIEGAKELAEALKANTILTSLDLSINRMCAASAAALADALKENSTLTSLNLGYNQISNAGAIALAEALKQNTVLVKLNLRNNGIKCQGAKALAEALEKNAVLKSLRLSYNGIQVAGGKALANSLKNNRALTSLCLWYNGIDSATAIAFAEALKDNASLTKLNLSDNEIDDAATMAFVEALKGNNSLKTLDLSDNQISDVATRALADVLKKKTTPTSFYFGKNNIYSLSPEISFNNFERNINISFLLKNSIKAAWLKPIARYSLEDREGALLKVKGISSNTNHVGASDAFDKLIETVLELRRSDDKDEVELTEKVLKKLQRYISSMGLDFETLDNTTYPKEFVRFLVARVNAKNMGDAEAQVMALKGLAQPFDDADLREEANAELIGLMNNSYFANLSEGSMQRRALDLLTLDLACQHPYERDLRGFALAAYSRLSGGGKITFDQVMNQLNDREAVQADFEKLLTEECESKGWSREVLRENSVEVLMQEFSPAPSRSTSPNPHGLFQPFVASESPVDEVKSPQKKAT